MKMLNAREHTTLFVAGRQLLLKQEWQEARPYFKNALLYGFANVRLKAALGLFCSYSHISLERFVSLSKRSAVLD